MHPDFVAICAEICAREDCPEELRDILVNVMSTGDFPPYPRLGIGKWGAVFQYAELAWSYGGGHAYTLTEIALQDYIRSIRALLRIPYHQRRIPYPKHHAP